MLRNGWIVCNLFLNFDLQFLMEMSAGFETHSSQKKFNISKCIYKEMTISTVIATNWS